MPSMALYQYAGAAFIVAAIICLLRVTTLRFVRRASSLTNCDAINHEFGVLSPFFTSFSPSTQLGITEDSASSNSPSDPPASGAYGFKPYALISAIESYRAESFRPFTTAPTTIVPDKPDVLVSSPTIYSNQNPRLTDCCSLNLTGATITSQYLGSQDRCMDALDNFDDRLRINRTTPALALEAVSSSNDYILKGIAVLARSRADALAQDLKHYKPRRAPPPRAFTSLPADSAVGIHEYISSFDKLQEHVEESWYYNNNNGYGNEISRCVRRELARLAHVRMNEHGFQWWPLPAPSIPLRPPPAISLAEYKLPRNDRIEIWRVNTADSADNMLLNEERARIDNDQEQDAKGNETILSVATRFVCMSPPPEDIWDGVVRNNNATRAGILLLRNESHELFHPDQNRQQQRMLQQGLLKSRRIRFRLDKPDNIIKHLSYQVTRNFLEKRTNPNEPPRDPSVMVGSSHLHMSGEELLSMAHSSKTVHSIKFFWNKYVTRVKACIAAHAAILELSNPIKLAPIEVFVTGDYLPLSEELPYYMYDNSDPHEVAIKPEVTSTGSKCHDPDPMDVDSDQIGDNDMMDIDHEGCDGQFSFTGASTLSLLADPNDKYEWSGVVHRYQRYILAGYAVWEHMRLIQKLGLKDPSKTSPHYDAWLHHARMFSRAVYDSELNDVDMHDLHTGGFDRANPFTSIRPVQDAQVGLPADTSAAIWRYFNAKHTSHLKGWRARSEEAAALAGVFPRGGAIGDADCDVETMHPLHFRRVHASRDVVLYGKFRRTYRQDRITGEFTVNAASEERNWHYAIGVVAPALGFSQMAGDSVAPDTGLSISPRTTSVPLASLSVLGLRSQSDARSHSHWSDPSARRMRFLSPPATTHNFATSAGVGPDFGTADSRPILESLTSSNYKSKRSARDSAINPRRTFDRAAYHPYATLRSR